MYNYPHLEFNQVSEERVFVSFRNNDIHVFAILIGKQNDVRDMTRTLS